MSGPVDTWMPWVLGAYFRDTTHLSTEQHGAYLLLLAGAWVRGGRLPDDDEQLGGICKLPPAKWAKHKPVLQKFFKVDGGEWTQKRLMAEYQRALTNQGSRSRAGKIAAEARWEQEKKESEQPVDPTNPWSLGKAMLKQQAGMTFEQAGKFLGKLCKENTEPAVLEALKAAQAKPPADLKSYLLGILGNKQKAKGFTDGLKSLAERSA